MCRHGNLESQSAEDSPSHSKDYNDLQASSAETSSLHGLPGPQGYPKSYKGVPGKVLVSAKLGRWSAGMKVHFDFGLS